MRFTKPMQIKSFETTTIEAKRFSKAGERMANIKIENNSAITQISKGEDDLSHIDFRFTANYTGLGYIKIEGRITVSELSEKTMDDWRRTNNLPVDDANAVHNAVVGNSMLSALLISREIKLPAPMPMPRINMQKKPEIRPSDGVEVA
ncbi:MAG TPA: hypothetical protein VMW85_04565 [Methanomassiliicoccales archaeon]|nr:hypothetical protein [Methanomassiliicoccales archaeon]